MRGKRGGNARHSSARRLDLRIALLCAFLTVPAPARGDSPRNATVAWFQATEQSLMDALVPGDKSVWERVMDDGCVVTSEEGKVTPKREFLEEFRPLPPGLTGGIAVRELTVQEFPFFAVVRYLADEWESVFGQRLTTQYRVTDTFRRAGSTWKMVASHVAVVTSDPPPQPVATGGWSGLAGTYRLLPDGWKFSVVLRDGKLYGGRDPAKLKPFIPLTPDAFVLQGTLGEWLFVVDKNGKAAHILNFRKFEPLVWTRVADAAPTTPRPTKLPGS